MALTLNDERVRELFAPHLEADETEVIYVAGAGTWRAPLLLHIIFGMFASFLTVLRSKWYLLGLTERRLMLLRLTITMQEKEFEAFPLSEIRSARIRKRFLERVIEIDLYNGQRYAINVVRWSTLKDQARNLEAISARFQHLKPGAAV